MAISISEANTVSEPYFGRKFTDNVYRRSALLTLLQSKKRMIEGGVDARFPVSYRELDTTIVDDPDNEIPFRTRQTKTAVQSFWTYYRTTNVLTLKEQTENQGDKAVVNLISNKAEEMMKAQATTIARSLYTKHPSGFGVNPLTDIISRDSFGGIDEDLFRALFAQAATGGKLQIYGSKTNSLAGAIADSMFDGDSCTHVIMSPHLRTQFAREWVKNNGRFDFVRDKSLIDLGLKTFQFEGTDFVIDQFLNENTTLQGSVFGIDIGALICYENRKSTTNGKWFDASPLGHPGGLARASIWAGQLTAVRRRTMFRWTGVTDFEYSA